MKGLTSQEVMRIVNRYIGVSGGYLGDFTYRSHADFYPEYCDLDYDPDEHIGTTRERFIKILKAAPSAHQARIIKGVIERFPVELGPPTRSKELRDDLLKTADRLFNTPKVATPELHTSSKAVERALADAESLIKSTGAPSAVDRIHTALHGHLKALCDTSGISYSTKATMTELFKLLRKNHPKLQATGPRANDVTKILRSTAAILDALNPVRNQASSAHPNPHILEPPEAILLINLTRSLLHYIDQRTS